MKKHLLKMLFLCLLAFAGMTTFAQQVKIYVDGIVYNLNTTDQTASVTSGIDKYSGVVHIPEKMAYNGITYSVTSIGSSAFRSCRGLTELTIPNSVTSIGEAAFFYCSGLTELTIPNSVTSIGDSVFFYCSGLTELTIPNSVTSIGSFAFSGCRSLTELTIPNSVTSIGNCAFSWCI